MNRTIDDPVSTEEILIGINILLSGSADSHVQATGLAHSFQQEINGILEKYEDVLGIDAVQVSYGDILPDDGADEGST